MIKSVSSDHSKMESLIPVTRNNSNFLILQLKGIIKDLENVGFSVICLTSDNAPINSTVWKKVKKIENFRINICFTKYST